MIVVLFAVFLTSDDHEFAAREESRGVACESAATPRWAPARAIAPISSLCIFFNHAVVLEKSPDDEMEILTNTSVYAGRRQIQLMNEDA